MTPVDVNTAARDMYNATGDTFFTDAQIYNWIWQGCHEIAKNNLIENVYTTSTVEGQQSYPFPTNALAIKRIIINGKKIKRITMRDDDAITLSNQNITSQGWPVYYVEYNFVIYLRPIPDGVYTLQIYTYDDSAQITATSSIPIPALFHFDLVDYCLFRMFSKDKDTNNAQFHKSMWDGHVKEALAWKRRMKRSDSFATVQSEDTLPVTILGEA